MSGSIRQTGETADEAFGYWPLWFGVLGGLTAWIVRLIAGASLVSWSCAHGMLGTVVQWGNSALFGLITLAALAVSIRIRRRAASVTAGDESWSAAEVLSSVGILMNAISLALIAAESVPIAFVDACSSIVS